MKTIVGEYSSRGGISGPLLAVLRYSGLTARATLLGLLALLSLIAEVGTASAATLPVGHMTTTNYCENCHSGKYVGNLIPISSNPFEVWGPINKVDHNDVIGTCAGCHLHNLTAAGGHSWVHETATCNWCHIPSFGWKSVPDPSAMRTCAYCHKSGWEVAKPANHAATTNACESCHTYPSWKTRSVDHSQTLGSCEGCHASSGSLYSTRSKTHPRTTDRCGACHSTTTWMTPYFADHNEVLGPCDDCHLRDAKARQGHEVTYVSKGCQLCHSTVAWKPAVNTPSTFHSSGDCQRCHVATSFKNDASTWVPIDVDGITIVIPAVNNAALPPDPGSIGQATIAGTDVDGNGVRDDVQRYIEVTYFRRSDQKRSAYSYAISQLKLIEMGAATPNKDDVANVVRKLEIDAACMEQRFPLEYQEILITLSAKTMNTKARALARFKATRLLAGDQIISSDNVKAGATCQ